MSTQTEVKAVLDERIANAITQCARAIGAAVTNGRRSCITCLYFDERAEGCALANGMRPPARVIALGCARFEEDIPF